MTCNRKKKYIGLEKVVQKHALKYCKVLVFIKKKHIVFKNFLKFYFQNWLHMDGKESYYQKICEGNTLWSNSTLFLYYSQWSFTALYLTWTSLWNAVRNLANGKFFWSYIIVFCSPIWLNIVIEQYDMYR